MNLNKRQSLRKELRIKALLTIDGEAPISLHTMDVAKFGMCLAGIPKPLTAGQQGLVAFDLFLNGQLHSLDVRVRIAYCISADADFRAGLQFIDLNSAGAVLIAQYVD